MSEIRLKSTGTIKLFENDNTSNVTIASPASLGADWTGTLPDADVTLVSGTMSTVALTGSTNNTIPTVTGANAISGEANLTFDGTDLTLGTGDIVFSTADKGVCLGVTTNTDSNTLDDYEEGTFTLAMHSGWSGTISTTTSTYTKIGRNVTVNFRGNLNDAEGNSSVRVSGFPFSLPNINVQVTAYYSQQQSVGLWISQGGYFYYQNTTVGGNNQGENAAWLDSATGVAFNVTYITT